MRLLRSLFGGAGLGLAVICVVLALLAQGGRFSSELDVLTNFAPAYLAAAGLAALCAAFGLGRARWAGLVLSAVAALSAAVLIAPEFLRDAGPSARPGAPGEIKVIQLNAWRDNPHPERVLDWLAREKPDVVLVEEVSPRLRALIQRRGRWRTAGLHGGMAILTPTPWLVMDRPHLPRGYDLTWVNATYAGRDAPYDAMVTHITWPTRPAHAVQSASLRYVLGELPRERMVLGGDFNSTPWTFRRRREDAALRLIRRDRAVATWPAPFPLLPIDHVYAGPGWATTGVRRGPNVGSDHYPLVVTLAPVARP